MKKMNYFLNNSNYSVKDLLILKRKLASLRYINSINNGSDANGECNTIIMLVEGVRFSVLYFLKQQKLLRFEFSLLRRREFGYYSE